MSEEKLSTGVVFAVLGIVAIVAIVGIVLLMTGKASVTGVTVKKEHPICRVTLNTQDANCRAIGCTLPQNCFGGGKE